MAEQSTPQMVSTATCPPRPFLQNQKLRPTRKTRRPRLPPTTAAGVSTTIRSPQAIIWNQRPRPPHPPAPAKKSPASVPAVATKSNNAPPPAAAKTVAATPKQPARFQPPALNKNSIVLQVAAVKLQRDALEMADAIQQKRFPSFVATSPADNFYHVQVGPYPDIPSAENAKRALEQMGFKPIIKH